MSAINLQCFEMVKSAFSDAVVSVAVTVSLNSTVVVEGLKLDATIARSLAMKGVTENIDQSILIPSALFPDVTALRGCPATVTQGSISITMRIMQTTEHALGGLVTLQFGNYDRVTA